MFDQNLLKLKQVLYGLYVVWRRCADPPMRTFSDYVMMSRLKRPDLNPSRLVPKDTFLDQIRGELGAKRRPECHLNTTVRPAPTSWKTAASIFSLPWLPDGT